MLTDLLMAGEPLDDQAYDGFDVPDLWTHLLAGGFAPKPGPLTIEVQEWQALGILAAKTYVPASEESRERGAG